MSLNCRCGCFRSVRTGSRDCLPSAPPLAPPGGPAKYQELLGGHVGDVKLLRQYGRDQRAEHKAEDDGDKRQRGDQSPEVQGRREGNHLAIERAREQVSK